MKTLLVRQSLCLNRLVESVGLLTPPGFDAAPSTSKAIESHVAVDNNVELVGFNPSATSSPGESSQGQKNKALPCVDEPNTKQCRLEEIQKSTNQLVRKYKLNTVYNILTYVNMLTIC